MELRTLRLKNSLFRMRAPKKRRKWRGMHKLWEIVLRRVTSWKKRMTKLRKEIAKLSLSTLSNVTRRIR